MPLSITGPAIGSRGRGRGLRHIRSGRLSSPDAWWLETLIWARIQAHEFAHARGMVARSRNVPEALTQRRMVCGQAGQERGLRGRLRVSCNKEDRHHGREHECHARGDHCARHAMSRSDRMIQHRVPPVWASLSRLGRGSPTSSRHARTGVGSAHLHLWPRGGSRACHGMRAEALAQSWTNPADMESSRLELYESVPPIGDERNASAPFVIQRRAAHTSTSTVELDSCREAMDTQSRLLGRVCPTLWCLQVSLSDPPVGQPTATVIQNANCFGGGRPIRGADESFRPGKRRRVVRCLAAPLANHFRNAPPEPHKLKGKDHPLARLGQHTPSRTRFEPGGIGPVIISTPSAI